LPPKACPIAWCPRLRPRRNHDALRRHPGDLVDADLVIAAHFEPGAQLAQVLDEVVRKRIVIVDDQNHEFPLYDAMRRIP
jgi:hypothetical protein